MKTISIVMYIDNNDCVTKMEKYRDNKVVERLVLSEGKGASNIVFDVKNIPGIGIGIETGVKGAKYEPEELDVEGVQRVEGFMLDFLQEKTQGDLN